MSRNIGHPDGALRRCCDGHVSGILLVVVAFLTLHTTRFCYSQDLPTLPNEGPAGHSIVFKVPPGLTTPPELRFERRFQSGKYCGPNSLYVLLRLCGRSVNYHHVLSAVPLTDRGASLSDLHAAAAGFDLQTHMRKDVTPEDLRSVAKPVMIHLKSFSSEADGTSLLDHFMVITSVLEDGTYMGIDTTNYSYVPIPAHRLVRNFSGYCLVVDPASLPEAVSPWWDVVAAGLLVLSVSSNALALRRLR